MTMEDPQSIERHLIEMFTLAGEYCLTIENAENLPKEELYRFISRISPLLYVRGILFPDTEEPEEEGNDRLVTEEQWEMVFNTLRNKFGVEDNFFVINPDADDSNELLKGSLAENLADVYQDMKDFAWLMSKNTVISRQYAAFEVKRLFKSNWGLKILNAQWVLHNRILKDNRDEEYSDLFE
jgi:hypothetical protein